jgi:hypothetical protein
MDETPVRVDRRDTPEISEIRARFFDTGAPDQRGHPSEAYTKVSSTLRWAINVLFDEIARLRDKYEPMRPQQ